MWELDCEESWAPKNWCFWTVVLEKTLESLLDCKEIQLVHSEGDQSWDFFGRNGVKAETPVLWPPHAKSWLIGKDSDAGRDWGQEEKGTTEDEMAGWHYWLDGCESEWTPGVGEWQGGWHAEIHGVAKSRTRLSDWCDLIWPHLYPFLYWWTFRLLPHSGYCKKCCSEYFSLQFSPDICTDVGLLYYMADWLLHFQGTSIWISLMAEAPLRRHKRCGFNPLVGKIPWRKAWQPAPVFFPKESHGEWRDGAKAKTTLSCGGDWWWKYGLML